jgi:hypothetical protein
VILVLTPPRDRRAAPPPTAVDILTLGYAISVERVTGSFDALRQELRGALGLEGPAPGVPDPGKAGRPALLWPALGLAFEPRRFVPVAAAVLVALCARWAVTWGGPLARLAGPALAAVLATVALAAGTTAAAAATHEMITEGGRLSVVDGLRALRRRPALLIGAAREAGLRVVVAVMLLVTVAVLASLEGNGGTAAVIVSRASAPLQALMAVTAVCMGVSVTNRLLAYAALAPQGQGLLMVQAALEVKRISAERELMPSRTLAPALAAALAVAVTLGGGAWLAVATWDAVAGAFGPLHPVARAVGRDAVWAVAAGIWCSFLGVSGLLAGYALGKGASREPVRAPEIITGTWGAGLRPAGKVDDEDPGA